MARFSQPDPKTRYMTSKPGMNTQFAADYSTEIPWNNFNYLGRPDYVGDDFKASSVSAATLDSSGYITNLNSSSGTAGDWFGYVILVGQEANLGFSGGQLVITWEGGNGVKPFLTGAGASLNTDGAFRRVYDITDWGGTLTNRIYIPSGYADSIFLNFSSWEDYEADPVRITEICLPEYEGTTRYGQPNFWNNLYLEGYRKYSGGIRTMNLQATNQQGSDKSVYFSDRRPAGYRTYSHGGFNGGLDANSPAGAPFEVVIDLFNQAGVPGWFNIPHRYIESTSSLEALATLIVETYNPDNGVMGLEYSNETWNGQFVQGQYCQSKGLIEDQNTSSFVFTDGRYGGDAYPQWRHAGMLSTSAMKVMGPILDAASSTGFQYCRIMNLQAGGTGRNQNSQDVNTSVPYASGSTETAQDWHDAVAISGYWGRNLLYEPQWSDNGASANLLCKQYFSVNTVNAYANSGLDGVWAEMRTELDFNRDDNEDCWEKNRSQFATRNWDEVLCYEGNHHMVWGTPKNQAPRLAQQMLGNYSSTEFCAMHSDALKLHNELFGPPRGTGGAFMHFVAATNPALGSRGVPATDTPSFIGHWGYLDAASAIKDADTDRWYNGRDYNEFNWYNSMRDYHGFNRKRSP